MNYDKISTPDQRLATANALVADSWASLIPIPRLMRYHHEQGYREVGWQAPSPAAINPYL